MIFPMDSLIQEAAKKLSTDPCPTTEVASLNSQWKISPHNRIKRTSRPQMSNSRNRESSSYQWKSLPNHVDPETDPEVCTVQGNVAVPNIRLNWELDCSMSHFWMVLQSLPDTEVHAGYLQYRQDSSRWNTSNKGITGRWVNRWSFFHMVWTEWYPRLDCGTRTDSQLQSGRQHYSGVWYPGNPLGNKKVDCTKKTPAKCKLARILTCYEISEPFPNAWVALNPLDKIEDTP